MFLLEMYRDKSYSDVGVFFFGFFNKTDLDYNI